MIADQLLCSVLVFRLFVYMLLIQIKLPDTHAEYVVPAVSWPTRDT